MPSWPTTEGHMMQPCQSWQPQRTPMPVSDIQLLKFSYDKILDFLASLCLVTSCTYFTNYNDRYMRSITSTLESAPLSPGSWSCLNPRLCPMACARLAARMCGSKTSMSTLTPTALPAQMVPTVEMVERPLSKRCPLQTIKRNRVPIN